MAIEIFDPRSPEEIIESIDAQVERGRVRMGDLRGVCGTVARYCLNNSGISLSSSDALLLVRAALASELKSH